MPILDPENFLVPLEAGVEGAIWRFGDFDPRTQLVSRLPELEALQSDFSVLADYAERKWAQGTIQNLSLITTRNSGSLGEFYGVVSERVDALKALLSNSGLFGLYRQVEQKLGEAWDALKNVVGDLLETIADMMTDVISVIPYIGVMVQIFQSMIELVKYIDAAMDGPEKPQVACGGWTYFNKGTDEQIARDMAVFCTRPVSTLDDFGAADWTQIFMPRSIGMRFTRLRALNTQVQHEGWRLEPVPGAYAQGEHPPETCFHMPNGLGQMLGWQAIKSYGGIQMMQSSRMDQVLPSVGLTALDLWGRCTQNGIDAFRVNLQQIAYWWRTWFSLSSRPYTLQDANAAASDSGLDVSCHDSGTNSDADFHLVKELHPIVMWEDDAPGKPIKIAAFNTASQLWSAVTPDDQNVGGQLATGAVLENFKEWLIGKIEDLPTGSPVGPHQGFTTLDPFDLDLLGRFGKQSFLAGQGWLLYPGRPFAGGAPWRPTSGSPVIPKDARLTYVSLGMWIEYIMEWYSRNQQHYATTQTAAYLRPSMGAFTGTSVWNDVEQTRLKMLQQPATCLRLEPDMIPDVAYRDAVQQVKINVAKGWLQGTTGGLTAPPDSLPPDQAPTPANPGLLVSGTVDPSPAGSGLAVLAFIAAGAYLASRR